MLDPVTRSSLRPGIVLMHGMPGNARGMAALGRLLAEHGAVVIAIDAPFARRAGPPVRFGTQDRAEQIQLIKDLQRAVDVLRARANVDDERIAYLGISYGGALQILDQPDLLGPILAAEPDGLSTAASKRGINRDHCCAVRRELLRDARHLA
ncbi:MAG TPA: alpha/beta fold hydrolase, partial [Vicinamibacterales bacterium]|nr:alpha/beta fold hydrolase [Vicinamibacterales bacterium]